MKQWQEKMFEAMKLLRDGCKEATEEMDFCFKCPFCYICVEMTNTGEFDIPEKWKLELLQWDF